MTTERQRDQEVVERLRRENLERVDAGGAAPPVLVKKNDDAARATPVAVVMADGYICWLTSWLMSENWVKSQKGDKLYSAATVAALEAEVAEMRLEVCRHVGLRRDAEKRADAAERRVAELRQALLGVEGALGPNVHLYDTTSDMARALEVATAALTKESP